MGPRDSLDTLKSEKFLAPASSQTMIPWLAIPQHSHCTYCQNYVG